MFPDSLHPISWYFVMRKPNFWAPGTNLIHLKRFIVENQNVSRFVTPNTLIFCYERAKFLSTRHESNTFKRFIVENQNVSRFVTPNILIFCYERAKFLNTRYESNAFKKVYCGKPKRFPIRYTQYLDILLWESQIFEHPVRI